MQNQIISKELKTGLLLSINSKPSGKRKIGRPRKIRIEKVVKSDGVYEPFSLEKIEKSIFLAGSDTKEYDKKQAGKIIAKIKKLLSQVRSKVVTTHEIRNLVEPVLAKEGYFQTARYYILYKERKEQAKREEFRIWEPEMSENAKTALINRCSIHNEEGMPLETPGQIFWRVAKHIAKAEINWGDEKNAQAVARDFFTRMASFKFVCTTSAMYESGNKDCLGQLSPCFVLKIEDSIPSIFKTLGEAALIQKNYGGTGFNFSAIRFKGDKVRNVPNAASGPVDFLQVYSAALSKVMQGSKKHGGNMGILNVDHPDIYEFISVKDEDGSMKNFNISVGVTDEFMEAVVADRKFALRNPRDGKVVKLINAMKLFKFICEHAHKTGDPGMIFLDRMEADNFTPSLGKLEATNPCGEQPLLPYESCNLSSVHLANHLIQKNGGWEINWDDLGETVKLVVRFLDDMIEINSYVLNETERMVKLGNRKIGLGVIGFAETLFRLGISYNSKEAVQIADKIAKYIKRKAEEASGDLAKVRGVFPNWDISTYKGTYEKYRNCTMLTIAPTGTVSMIGNVTSGIEPTFALAYTRRSFYDRDKSNRSTTSMYFVNPVLETVLKENKLYSKKLIENIADNSGSLKGFKDVPEKIKRIFVTTHEISPEWHVKIQAAWQKHVDNAVSKTINFSHNAKVSDVEKAYLLAWKLGCKGITIYRDGSKEDQVLNTGNGTKKKNTKGKVLDKQIDKCPDCGGIVYHEGGCIACRECGWSVCKA